jgi:hypothetical protein
MEWQERREGMRKRVKCSGLDTNINRLDEKSRETEKKRKMTNQEKPRKRRGKGGRNIKSNLCLAPL